MSRWPEIAGVRAFWPTPYREVPAELFETSVAVASGSTWLSASFHAMSFETFVTIALFSVVVGL